MTAAAQRGAAGRATADAHAPRADDPVTERLDAEDLDAEGRLHHAVRGRLTVAVGEVELVLAEPDVPAVVRAASAGRVLAALAEVEALLARHAAQAAR